MADVKIIDIDGVQWDMKDQEARNRLAELEKGVEVRTIKTSQSGDFSIKLITISNVRFLQINFDGFEVEINNNYFIESFPSDFGLTKSNFFMASCDRNDQMGRVPVEILVASGGGLYLYVSTYDNWNPNFGRGKLFGGGLFLVN